MNLALHAARRHAHAAEASATAADAKTAAESAKLALRYMEDELARHALVIQTLLRICARKGLFADKEFLALLEEVDLEDGVRDGKRKKSKAPKECAGCGKPARQSAMACIYCGAEFPTKNPL